MAQLVEQLIRNQQVAGSNPAISSKKMQPLQLRRLHFFVLQSPAVIRRSGFN